MVDQGQVGRSTPARPPTVVALVVTVGLLAAALWWIASGATPQAAPAPASHVVSYYVDGTAPVVSVSFVGEDAAEHRLDERTLPLHTTFGTAGLTVLLPEGTAAVIAVRSERRSGSLRCRIEVDGVEVAQDVADEPYAAVRCVAEVARAR